MALSTVVKSFQDGSLVIEDGTGTPLSITVQFEMGDFSLSGLSANQQEVSAYESRGKFKTLRHTTRTYPTVSFSAMAAEFSEDSTGTLADALLKNGTVWSAAVSTLGTGLPYTVKMTFNVEGTDFGDAADGQIVLDDVYATIDFAEGDPNSFSVSGTVYGAITGDLAVDTP